MNRKTIRNIVVFVLLSPVIVLVLSLAIPYLAVYGVFNYCRGLWLRIKFRRKWGPEGKTVLFVYSDSPNWQEYIEREILPRLSPYAVSLNYSRRSEWKTRKPLEAKIWEQWRGDREFNPIAIVLPDRGKVKTVSFYQAFRDFKHGRDRLLRQKEEELFGLISQLKAGP